jgi:hypothetical protein
VQVEQVAVEQVAVILIIFQLQAQLILAVVRVVVVKVEEHIQIVRPADQVL